MLAAAEELRFEYAAKLRDEIRELRRELDAATRSPPPGRARCSRAVRCSVARARPSDAREDVLDGLLPLLPAGIVSGRSTTPPSRSPRRPRAARRGRAAAPRPAPLDALSSARTLPADWRERRARFGGGAVLISDRLVVRSPWDPPRAEGLLEVVVERGGSGFGSGSHPTTQMCLGPAARHRAPPAAPPTSAAASGRWPSRRRSSAGHPCRARARGARRSRSRARTRTATASRPTFAVADIATARACRSASC